MISETLEPNPIVLETVVFTGISAGLIGAAKPSELMPLFRYVASEWGLHIVKKKDFDLVKKIIIHSIKNN